MPATRHLSTFVSAGAVMLVAWGLGGIAQAAEPFALSSSTFKDGTMMPKKVANKNPQNPNCVGDNGRRSCLGPATRTAPRALP